MAALRAVNLGVRFLLELAALAGFAYWGRNRGGEFPDSGCPARPAPFQT